MNTVISIEECTNCKACRIVCPVNAISLKKNREGFFYPVIDKSLCIECGLCLKTCPVSHRVQHEIKPVDFSLYAARHNDHSIINKSSSGGIFYALAQNTLSKEGIVFGVGFDENWLPTYKSARSLEDLKLLMGSKYVEASFDVECMHDFLNAVSSEIPVLFCGTACQVEGLIAICEQKKINTDNVLFVDFFTCSGVCSRVLWLSHLAHASLKNIRSIEFRNKDSGWRSYALKIEGSKKSYSHQMLLSPWGRLFLTQKPSVRLSCNACSFKTSFRKTDISLGDLWNTWYIPKKWQDDKGVSLVKPNSFKGETFFNECKEYADFVKVPLAAGKWAHFDRQRTHVTKKQLQEPREFWNVFETEGYQGILKKYCAISIKEKIKVSIVKPILIKTGLIRFIDKYTM